MRIAYILNTLMTGGAEREVMALAEGMAARGHSVRIVALRGPEPDELAPSVPVRHLGIRRTPFSLLCGFLRGAHILREFRPDVLHSNNFHANFLARLLRLYVPRTRIVSTVHNVYEGGSARMLALRLTDPLSHRTVAVSQAAAEAAIAVRAVPRRKCSVIVNSIDCVEFAPDPERRADLRAEAGIAGDFVWLASGRIAPAKDYPSLLRAFRVVLAAEPATQLWIAGAGNAQLGTRYRALADELGIAAQVRWLGLRRDMPALLDAADGFVLASAWEGMPLALAEALAMKKRIVATDVGGVRELAGECGAIVPARNPAALAQAMLAAMRKPADERETEQAGCARMERHFNIEHNAAAWEAYYAEAARPPFVGSAKLSE